MSPRRRPAVADWRLWASFAAALIAVALFVTSLYVIRDNQARAQRVQTLVGVIQRDRAESDQARAKAAAERDRLADLLDELIDALRREGLDVPAPVDRSAR